LATIIIRTAAQRVKYIDLHRHMCIMNVHDLH